MKKNIVKIVSLLLVVAVVAALFVACKPTHTCTSKCTVCGGCTNKECGEAACANKCPGNHDGDGTTTKSDLCPHACEYCFRCTDPTATGKLCTEKCVCKDFAADFKLNFNSPRKKVYDAKVRVMAGMEIGYIDGDTTHFADNSRPDDYAQFKDSVLKVRYAAVNTPESTGNVEAWGKKASNFTHDRLKNATHIIVEAESTSGDFEADSTGSRYMGWVWYTNSTDANPAADTYRLLNLELLQYGLGKGSGTATSSYGEICGEALDYAMTNKICVFNSHKDPDFYYGTAIPVSMKTLRVNPTAYLNKKVAVEGVVAYVDGQTAYLIDQEAGMTVGYTIYYGFNPPLDVVNWLQIGNRVLIVGTVGEYNGSYQISGLQYNPRRPNDVNNCKLISTGNKTSYKLTAATDFVAKESVEFTYEKTLEDGTTTEVKTLLDYAQAVLGTPIEIKNLKVTKIYTTASGTSQGAMTLTCTADGVEISVRTDVLTVNGKTLTEADFSGKTINVRGIVEHFNGNYQIKVFDASSIEVQD